MSQHSWYLASPAHPVGSLPIFLIQLPEKLTADIPEGWESICLSDNCQSGLPVVEQAVWALSAVYVMPRKKHSLAVLVLAQQSAAGVKLQAPFIQIFWGIFR